jgi:hypothetical protein
MLCIEWGVLLGVSECLLTLVCCVDFVCGMQERLSPSVRVSWFCVTTVGARVLCSIVRLYKMLCSCDICSCIGLLFFFICLYIKVSQRFSSLLLSYYSISFVVVFDGSVFMSVVRMCRA